jgi:hypothetical protein
MIYQLQTTLGDKISSVSIVGQNISIPFAPANTDYQRFKVDLASGAVLNNADGSAMTAEQITEFLQGLD